MNKMRPFMIPRTMNVSEMYRYEPLEKPQRNQCYWCCVVPFIIIIMGIIIIITFVFPWITSQCPFHIQSVPSLVQDFVPQTVSFSSCMNNWGSHNLMDHIKSDVHIFLGDNIYGDDYNYNFIEKRPKFLSFVHLPTHLLWYYQMMYNKLSCRGTFQKFMRRIKFVLSVWDDHDYGIDDELSENPMKYASKIMFVDFWKLNKQRQNVNGIYGSYMFQKENKQILFIIPDLVFEATQTQLFSDKQWSWLKTLALQYNNTKKVICFSHQVVDYTKKYKNEILSMLLMFDSSTTIFISGDPHIPSINYLPYGHIEITSSPLEQNLPAIRENKTCISSCGVVTSQNNFGVLDFNNNKALIYGLHGKILQTNIF